MAQVAPWSDPCVCPTTWIWLCIDTLSNLLGPGAFQTLWDWCRLWLVVHVHEHKLQAWLTSTSQHWASEPALPDSSASWGHKRCPKSGSPFCSCSKGSTGSPCCSCSLWQELCWSGQVSCSAALVAAVTACWGKTAITAGGHKWSKGSMITDLRTGLCFGCSKALRGQQQNNKICSYNNTYNRVYTYIHAYIILLIFLSNKGICTLLPTFLKNIWSFELYLFFQTSKILSRRGSQSMMDRAILSCSKCFISKKSYSTNYKSEKLKLNIKYIGIRFALIVLMLLELLIVLNTDLSTQSSNICTRFSSVFNCEPQLSWSSF